MFPFNYKSYKRKLRSSALVGNITIDGTEGTGKLSVFDKFSAELS